ncbi:unnamed protein product [Paramecium sonneborni]|uniref:Uncharacterized protein n=1 Tax=Paramecium sonneborni TaxID=65129 RepID=A0A8S1RSZ1_9CILI|nr:unnamed protein product [Paramecium sonneborni]
MRKNQDKKQILKFIAEFNLRLSQQIFNFYNKNKLKMNEESIKQNSI